MIETEEFSPDHRFGISDSASPVNLLSDKKLQKTAKWADRDQEDSPIMPFPVIMATPVKEVL